jgi:uncharacterized OB-fold protein
MTDDSRTICKRCGFSNVPGDQFCGSCGAFLEWEGRAAPDAATPPGTPVTPAPVDPVVSDPAAASWGAPYGDPLPTPPAAAWPAEDDDEEDGADLVRCPSCGIANPASRTFCQSCGATLAAAVPIQAASHEQIAAAVAMTPTPTEGTAATAESQDATDGRRRIPSWVIGVGVVGVLVGVALVLAGVALRGPGPSTGATGSGAVPSGAASSGGATGGGPSASASTSGTPEALELAAAKASSVLDDRPRYRPAMAIDGKLDTAWQEGAQQEKDQWIEVSFDPSRADTLLIRNGYQASQEAFRGNRRLKDVLVTVGDGAPIPVRLKDAMKAQEVDLGGVTGATSVRVTIVSTYAGEATSVEGSPFDDAAVSELSVLGVPGG